MWGMWGPSQPAPDAALKALAEGKSLQTLISAPQMPPQERARLVDQVRRVYKDLNYQLIWIDGDRPSGHYREFAKALASARDRGLPASSTRRH